MTVEELLKKYEINDEAAKAITEAHLDGLKNLRNEAKEYRLKAKELEAQNDKSETLLGKFLERMGIDADDDDAAAKAQAYFEGKSSEGNSEVSKLQKEIAKIQKSLELKEVEASRFKKDNEINALIGKFDGLNDSGKKLLRYELSEKYNDDFEFDAFKDEFVKANENLFEAKGKGGSGTTNNNNGGGVKKWEEMTLTEQSILQKTSPELAMKLQKEG